MVQIDYVELYALQDRVLARIFSVASDFYLTGGSCLSRFYQEKRYSDGLDFFVTNSNRFGFSLKKIKALLSGEFEVSVDIEAKDFCRLKIDSLLQLDFVNDRVAYFKEPVILENGYVIDNIENILSNKITAVIGRDDPKDIFDIYLISRFYAFDWPEIIHSAKEKSAFNLEELIVRMKTFPTEFFNRINLVDKNFLANFTADFADIIVEIIEGERHYP